MAGIELATGELTKRDNNMLHICEGLSIKQGSDGHWLNFSSKDGQHASICLENQKGICNKAMIGWAKDTWAFASQRKATGMYGETPKVFAGKFTISQQGGNVWMDNGEDEGMECNAAIIEEALQRLFNDNF